MYGKKLSKENFFNYSYVITKLMPRFFMRLNICKIILAVQLQWTVPQLSIMIIYSCTWSILIQ